jgi:hypothetical protein
MFPQMSLIIDTSSWNVYSLSTASRAIVASTLPTPILMISIQIDEIHYGPPSDRKIANNVIGGAGTYGSFSQSTVCTPSL